MRNLSPETSAAAHAQSGLVTRRQLFADGFRPDQIARRIARGEWRDVSCSVVSTSMLPLSRLGHLWAASLHYEQAVLAGSSALEILGMPTPHDGQIHLLGTRTGRSAPLPGCVMHTGRTASQLMQAPAREAPLDAVVHTLRWAITDRQAIFQAIWGIQRGFVNFEELQHAVRESAPSPGSARAKRRMSLLIPGTHSMNELDFAHGCRAHGLPEPQRQRPRTDSEGRARYTDAEFRVGKRSLVVEIDGMQHLDAAVRVDDEWRANEFVLEGDRVLRVSSLALRLEPERAYRQIRRALARLSEAA